MSKFLICIAEEMQMNCIDGGVLCSSMHNPHSLHRNCWPHFIFFQSLSKPISNKLAFVPATLIMEAHIYYPFLFSFLARAAKPMLIIGHRCCYLNIWSAFCLTGGQYLPSDPKIHYALTYRQPPVSH